MNLYEFKELNKSVGNHWFDNDTMSFFKTKVITWDTISGYFITRESFNGNEKRYSVRLADFNTGRVNTVGNFYSYESLSEAKSALKKVHSTTDLRTKEL
jgi:hypothetical protein